VGPIACPALFLRSNTSTFGTFEPSLVRRVARFQRLVDKAYSSG